MHHSTLATYPCVPSYQQNSAKCFHLHAFEKRQNYACNISCTLKHYCKYISNTLFHSRSVESSSHFIPNPTKPPKCKRRKKLLSAARAKQFVFRARANWKRRAMTTTMIKSVSDTHTQTVIFSMYKFTSLCGGFFCALDFIFVYTPKSSSCISFYVFIPQVFHSCWAEGKKVAASDPLQLWLWKDESVQHAQHIQHLYIILYLD